MKERVHPLVGRWASLVQGSAECAGELLDAIEDRLIRADIAGLRVRSSPIRGMLTASLSRVPDAKQYVRTRPHGIHLEVEHISVLEPTFWKARFAWLLTGESASWSLPMGQAATSEVRMLIVIVRQAVLEASRAVADQASGPEPDLEEVLKEW